MEKVMVIVNEEVVLDYAYPCMKAERGLRNLHEAAIDRRLNDAIECGLLALADLKLTINALKEMKAKEDAQSRMVLQQSQIGRAHV